MGNGQFADAAALGSNDVTSMKIEWAQGDMTINFPQKYNVGAVSDGSPGNPTSTKNVKVRVTRVPGETDAYFIVYLFDFADFREKDVYGVYDPEVTGSLKTTSIATTAAPTSKDVTAMASSTSATPTSPTVTLSTAGVTTMKAVTTTASPTPVAGTSATATATAGATTVQGVATTQPAVDLSATMRQFASNSIWIFFIVAALLRS